MKADLVTAAGVSVALRRAVTADEHFLHDLYADRRTPEVAALGWPNAGIRAFIDMQFRAQQEGYASAFPDATHWIVLVDAVPVGRLLVDRRPHEHLVVDVVILSAYQRRGIGTALMEAVVDDARGAAVPVRLTVALSEPHLKRWYERLGFQVVDGDGLNLRMVRR
jgi:ribosomal protein S18 acetylase RimI-like enzyme